RGHRSDHLPGPRRHVGEHGRVLHVGDRAHGGPLAYFSLFWQPAGCYRQRRAGRDSDYTGSVPLSITGIAITGANSSDFAQTNTCPLSPSTLAASGTCTISVTFTPTASRARSGAVTITDTPPDALPIADLSTAATAPAVGLSPASVSFGNQQVSTSSAAQG